MSLIRKQNSATHPVAIYLLSSVDHVTPVTGATVAVALSKDGGNSFAAAAGTVVEAGNGVYWLAGNAGDRDTLGECVVKATAAGADQFITTLTIVPFDPFDGARLGLTSLPNAAPGTAGGSWVLGANVGNTSFTATTLGRESVIFDGLALINTNTGGPCLRVSESFGFSGVSVNVGGACVALTSTAGHVFQMAAAANKDVFHSTVSGSGLIFNPAFSVATITPIQATVANPIAVDADIVVTQYSAQSFTWNLVDANNTPVNLAGKVVEFRGFSQTTGIMAISYLTTDPSPAIVVGGASNNQVTVTFKTTDTTAVPNVLLYTIWDKTDTLPLAEGKVTFKAAAQP